MLALLLVAYWSWDRVLTDCNGGSEVIDHYEWMATARTISDCLCTDDNGQAVACPCTIPAPPIVFRQFSDPGFGVSVTVADDPVGNPDLLPTPPVGGLTAWPWPSPENPDPVVAVDRAGNRSGCH